MTRYYWYNEGRLGNLLFQYVAILGLLRPGDKVYAFRNMLFDLVEPDPRFVVVPGTGRISRKINFEFNNLAMWAVRLKMVGSVRAASFLMLDRYVTESAAIDRTDGKLQGIFVVRGFFQYGRFQHAALRLRPRLMESAALRLGELIRNRTAVAVHIRLSDYGDWPVLGVPGVIIPAQWYRKRMSEIRERVTSPCFVVFSDDLPAAMRLGLGHDVVYAQGGGILDDFSAMALCEHAIISPSSFAWWAALARRDPQKIVMAPQYWAGFKRNTWYPPTIMTERIEYYPVESAGEDAL